MDTDPLNTLDDIKSMKHHHDNDPKLTAAGIALSRDKRLSAAEKLCEIGTKGSRVRGDELFMASCLLVAARLLLSHKDEDPDVLAKVRVTARKAAERAAGLIGSSPAS